MLTLVLANEAGLRWSQNLVTDYHYLHTPVDVRCRPLAYQVMLFERPVGCLIFGRPEATKVLGWYGSVKDVEARVCPLTRWQVLNLARVYLDPCLQRGGHFDHPRGLVGPSVLPFFYDRCNEWHPAVASYVLDLALERIVFDYLYHRPPVWMEQPYELVHILSYNDTKRHRGIIYQAAGFELVRKNNNGIQTYRRVARPLTAAEHVIIARRSREDKRAQRLRAVARNKHMKQLSWEEEFADWKEGSRYE
jgi:hypothetical protein